MTRIPILIIAFYFMMACSFAQTSKPADSSNYQERPLKVNEVNFVSGYYHQDGNHSAVTGGVGTELLTDFANTIELKLSNTNLRGNKNILTAELGIDHYTSASSDNIKLPGQGSISSASRFSLTGPSRQDTRVYPSLNYAVENEKKGITLGIGGSYSHEFDYQSRGANLNLVKTSKNKNTELSIKLLTFFDLWTVIYPYELRPAGYGNGSHRDGSYADIRPRNSYQATFTLSQIITRRLQMALLFDPSYQQGQLTTLYQRVYFTNGSERVEKLPDTRLKIPIAIRANYFLGDRIIIRSYYRYYQDDWGNKAHTINLEVPIKLNPFLSLSPFYRFSSQSGIKYFAAYKAHALDETYYTSDYDLSKFRSNFLGMGIRISPPDGVLGNKRWNSLELRYGHYIRSTDLVANSVSLALKFK